MGNVSIPTVWKLRPGDEETFKQIDWQAKRHEQAIGYIVECDLEYPSELHDMHNDYPMAPERLDIQVEMLSDTQVQLSRHYARARAKTNFKLVPNLMPKKKYVVHYLNLKFYLDHGMRLGKVHRVIKFAQAPWMEPYISMNTKMRGQAKKEMEKDFLKPINNALYRKTCEN